MKNFLLTLMVVLIGGTVFVKQDPLADGRYQCFDKDWRRTGYIIQNRLSPDRYDIFDQNWERKGRLEKRNSKMWKMEKD